MALSQAKVAFVAGANGISGNAIVEHLIRTPKADWYGLLMQRFFYRRTLVGEH